MVQLLWLCEQVDFCEALFFFVYKNWKVTLFYFSLIRVCYYLHSTATVSSSPVFSAETDLIVWSISTVFLQLVIYSLKNAGKGFYMALNILPSNSCVLKVQVDPRHGAAALSSTSDEKKPSNLGNDTHIRNKGSRTKRQDTSIVRRNTEIPTE